MIRYIFKLIKNKLFPVPDGIYLQLDELEAEWLLQQMCKGTNLTNDPVDIYYLKALETKLSTLKYGGTHQRSPND